MMDPCCKAAAFAGVRVYLRWLWFVFASRYLFLAAFPDGGVMWAA